MFLLVIRILGALATVVLMVSCTSEQRAAEELVENERWYSDKQVENGAAVYAQYCISCHLAEAKGTENWKKTLPDGSYPPPPLNGTAHTWHHSIEVLIRVIQEGGVPHGGRMPPFKGILTENQELAVIAYVQSFWSDEIYSRWQEITQ